MALEAGGQPRDTGGRRELDDGAAVVRNRQCGVFDRLAGALAAQPIVERVPVAVVTALVPSDEAAGRIRPEVVPRGVGEASGGPLLAPHQHVRPRIVIGPPDVAVGERLGDGVRVDWFPDALERVGRDALGRASPVEDREAVLVLVPVALPLRPRSVVNGPSRVTATKSWPRRTIVSVPLRPPAVSSHSSVSPRSEVAFSDAAFARARTSASVGAGVADGLARACERTPGSFGFAFCACESTPGRFGFGVGSAARASEPKLPSAASTASAAGTTSGRRTGDRRRSGVIAGSVQRPLGTTPGGASVGVRRYVQLAVPSATARTTRSVARSRCRRR